MGGVCECECEWRRGRRQHARSTPACGCCSAADECLARRASTTPSSPLSPPHLQRLAQVVVHGRQACDALVAVDERLALGAEARDVGESSPHAQDGLPGRVRGDGARRGVGRGGWWGHGGLGQGSSARAAAAGSKRTAAPGAPEPACPAPPWCPPPGWPPPRSAAPCWPEVCVGAGGGERLERTHRQRLLAALHADRHANGSVAQAALQPVISPSATSSARTCCLASTSARSAERRFRSSAVASIRCTSATAARRASSACSTTEPPPPAIASAQSAEEQGGCMRWLASQVEGRAGAKSDWPGSAGSGESGGRAAAMAV